MTASEAAFCVVIPGSIAIVVAVAAILLAIWKERGWALVALGVAVASALICAHYQPIADRLKDQERQDRYNALYGEGFNSRKAGVPANANPHIRYPNDARVWLTGWSAAGDGK